MADSAWPGGRAPHKIGQDIMARLERERPKTAARTHEIVDEEIAKWSGCLADMVRDYVRQRLMKRREQRIERGGT